MRIQIDEARCSGHGRCYTLVPSLFDADEQGRGFVLADSLAADDLEAARSAVFNCPEQAISIVAARRVIGAASIERGQG